VQRPSLPLLAPVSLVQHCTDRAAARTVRARGVRSLGAKQPLVVKRESPIGSRNCSVKVKQRTSRVTFRRGLGTSAPACDHPTDDSIGHPRDHPASRGLHGRRSRPGDVSVPVAASRRRNVRVSKPRASRRRSKRRGVRCRSWDASSRARDVPHVAPPRRVDDPTSVRRFEQPKPSASATGGSRPPDVPRDRATVELARGRSGIGAAAERTSLEPRQARGSSPTSTRATAGRHRAGNTTRWRDGCGTRPRPALRRRGGESTRRRPRFPRAVAALRALGADRSALETRRAPGLSELSHLLSDLADRLLLQLTDALARQVVLVADLLQRQLVLVVEAEAPANDA